MRRWTAYAVLLLATLAGSGAAMAGSGAQPVLATACRPTLVVDVWGNPVRWEAVQAGLTTGGAATLWAKASGCAGLELIAYRYVRPGASVQTHACAGPECRWRVWSAEMKAVDFQAYARTSTGKRVGSNVIRVAWAGANTIVGTWDWYFACPGKPLAKQGTVEFRRDHSTAYGSKIGRWDQTGPAVDVVWPDATDEMKLVNPRTMAGKSTDKRACKTTGYVVKGVKQT